MYRTLIIMSVNMKWIILIQTSIIIKMQSGFMQWVTEKSVMKLNSMWDQSFSDINRDIRLLKIMCIVNLF